MALSHSFTLAVLLCLSSILFTITLSFASPEIKALSLVSQICARTINPPLCNQAFFFTPGSATADLKGLGYMSIDIALKRATDASSYIVGLVRDTIDVNLKGKYATCAKNYANTVGALKMNKLFLDKGDIPSFRAYSSVAFNGPVTCQSTFIGAPTSPIKLVGENKDLEGLISIVMVIGARLAGQ